MMNLETRCDARHDGVVKWFDVNDAVRNVLMYGRSCWRRLSLVVSATTHDAYVLIRGRDVWCLR